MPYPSHFYIGDLYYSLSIDFSIFCITIIFLFLYFCYSYTRRYNFAFFCKYVFSTNYEYIISV